MKTGALFAFAVAAGALLGRAGPQQTAALDTYADHLGFAFQIADDLLDAEGDAAVVGKATGKDAAAGKATLIGSWGSRARATRSPGRSRPAKPRSGPSAPGGHARGRHPLRRRAGGLSGKSDRTGGRVQANVMTGPRSR